MISERLRTLLSAHTPRDASPLLLARAVGLVATLLIAAIFGFFYAWVCSTMWGLDAADPRVAIAAMQAMNGSVRNAVFFPAFFLTPAVLALAGALARHSGRNVSAGYFGASAVLYLVGGLLLTMFVNVPMNEALGQVVVSESVPEAASVWSAYSTPWQRWNLARTFASGLSLTLALLAMLRLGGNRSEGERGA